VLVACRGVSIYRFTGNLTRRCPSAAPARTVTVLVLGVAPGPGPVF